MTPSEPLARADGAAREGNIDCQDSQAIFDAHRALFGAATPGNALNQPRARAGVSCDAVGDRGDGAVEAMPDAPAAADEPMADSVYHVGSERRTPLGDTLPADDGPHSNATMDSRDTSAPVVAGKLGISQDTPTQINEDRDYGAYRPVPSSPVDRATDQNTGNRTLNPGEAGAVDSANFSDHARPSSQISEDGGFDATRSEWRTADATSQLNSGSAQTPYRPHAVAAPETPALPKNPFAAKPNITAPLAASQLFDQTQQLSSAVKVSPTSSRPSPPVPIDSISPNIFQASPLKHRANVSSPADVRTSSPMHTQETPATVLRSQARTAVGGQDEREPTKEDIVPESPTFQSKPPVARPPLAHYEPMKQSQERKASGSGPPVRHGADDGFDQDDEAFLQLQRRKRVERKRALAAEEMDRVSLVRQSGHHHPGKPSRKKRRLDGDETPVSDAAPGKLDPEDQKVVSDSQGAPTASVEAPADSTKAATGEATAALRSHNSSADATPGPSRETGVPGEDLIPATSPVQPSSVSRVRSIEPASGPDLPTLEERAEDGAGQDAGESPSQPPVRRRIQRRYGSRGQPTKGHAANSPTLRVLQGNKAVSSPSLADPTSALLTSHPPIAVERAASRNGAAAHGPDVEMLDDVPTGSQIESSGPVRPRARRGGRDVQTPLQPRTKEPPPAPSSTFTTLSVTPLSSSKTTPGTQASPAPARKPLISMVSPASGSNLRKRTLRSAVEPESPQPSRAALSRRSMRQDSESPDELHHSPTGSTFGRSLALPRCGRSFRQSVLSTHRARLLDGMVFALSLQSDRSEQQRARLETRITQAGGTILKDGFQPLFEHSAMPGLAGAASDDDSLTLTKASSHYGFAALIADGHSRKPKYMQALALSLPCLAPRWVTKCLDKGHLVDWEPYLLSAGPSAVLGEAVRSRSLTAYPAAAARLSDVLEHRGKLLQGQTVLAVVDAKKARNQARQQYMFLMQAMGPASLSRATPEQARGILRERQRAAKPVDWLYLDGCSAGNVDALLAPRETGSKRKKMAAAPPLGGYVRVLTDELVIQSLIFGQMVEEEDVDF